MYGLDLSVVLLHGRSDFVVRLCRDFGEFEAIEIISVCGERENFSHELVSILQESCQSGALQVRSFSPAFPAYTGCDVTPATERCRPEGRRYKNRASEF